MNIKIDVSYSNRELTTFFESKAMRYDILISPLTRIHGKTLDFTFAVKFIQFGKLGEMHARSCERKTCSNTNHVRQ